MQHADNLKLLSYWNRIRGEERAPQKADFEPCEISDIIKTTFLIKFYSDIAKLELVGGHICQWYGCELIGKTFNEFWLNGVDRLPVSLAASSAEYKTPIELKADGLTQDNSVMAFELVLLPLCESSTPNKWLVGSLSCIDNGYANPISKLAGLSMLSHKPFSAETIPVDFKKTSNRPAPIAKTFANQSAQSRTINFSLIDGGRKD